MYGQKKEKHGDFHNEKLWEKKQEKAIRNRDKKRSVKVTPRNVQDFIEEDEFND